MSPVERVLLVAATERELCGHPGLVCGVGPVEAAAASARALSHEPPDAVVHVGVAGARGIPAGTLVAGTESVYCDLAAEIPLVSRLEPDAALLAAVREAVPDALALPIGTSAAVNGPCGSEPQGIRVEGMEGFAVLRACALAGVPAVEVRAVSNELDEQDRSRWEIDLALASLDAALPQLLAAAGK
jgi:nucleoside phosphorylase